MKTICIFLILVFARSAFGQESLTLQECADLLFKNESLVLKENSEVQQLTVRRNYHYWNLVPTLSLSSNLNTNFGRRVDPFTNTFATSQVNSQSFGLNTNIPVFSGLNYIHSRKSMDLNLTLSTVNKDQKLNTYLIRLIDLYELLCKLQNQINHSNKRIALYKTIQESQKTLFQAGRIAHTDTLKSYNSLLNEQLIQVALEKDYRINEIELNFLIGLPLTQHNNYAVESIKQLTTRPEFDPKMELSKIEIRQKISETELAIAKSALLPSISIGGIIGTGFSTNNKDYTLPDNPTKPYNQQISQNLYEGIGVYLSIPILNRGTWLKSKQLYTTTRQQLSEETKLQQQIILKEQLTLEQKMLSVRAEIVALRQIADNLEIVYNSSLELYAEQRINYTELETSLIDWQTKCVELESKKLEYEKLSILNP